MRQKNTSLFLLFLLIVGTLNSCSFLSPEENPQQTSQPSEGTTDSPTAKVSVDDLAEKKGSALSDIEVLWQVPTESVEGFVIHYGPNIQKMDQEIKIFSKDLEIVEDAKHGSVYRYVLGNVPLNETLFISIAAFNGDEVSANSSVFEVRGETGLAP